MSEPRRRGVPRRPANRTVIDFRKTPDYTLELQTPEVTEVVMFSENVLILAPPGSTLVITLKDRS